MKILIVEDEGVIVEDVAANLRAEDFIVDTCSDGEEAWFLGSTEDYNAIVLDLGLPNLDGLTILKRWRAEGRKMPVIVLTARDNWTEKVDGINAGADDYVTKPFQMEELIARIGAVLRRVHGHASPIMTHGSMELDTRTQTMKINGNVVHLTALEYRLMRYFFYNSDRILPAPELIEHVYGENTLCEGNVLEVLIARLRRKLGKDKIETRRRQGYRLKALP